MPVGYRVVRYGTTRQWVLGLTVVTMDGTVLRLNGALEKNNTGVDLRQLFIGSEGIWGVITEAVLKLVTKPQHTQVGFFAVANPSTAPKLPNAARQDTHLTIQAFELVDHASLQVVLDEKGRNHLLDTTAPAYVLLEVEGPDEETLQGSLEAWAMAMAGQELISDGFLAQSSKDAAALWQLREGIGEGVLTGALHMLASYVYCRKRGWSGTEATRSAKALAAAAWEAKWALMIPIIILGGIYGEIMTPTEAAALGAFCGLVVGIVVHKEIDRANIVDCFLKVRDTSAIVIILMAMATLFGRIMTLEHMPSLSLFLTR